MTSWPVWGWDAVSAVPGADGALPEGAGRYPGPGELRIVALRGHGDTAGALGDMGRALPGFTHDDARPGMHATDTIDVAMVVTGKVTIEAGDGTKATLGPGEVYVCNEALHRWHYDEPTHIVFVATSTAPRRWTSTPATRSSPPAATWASRRRTEAPPHARGGHRSTRSVGCCGAGVSCRVCSSGGAGARGRRRCAGRRRLRSRSLPSSVWRSAKMMVMDDPVTAAVRGLRATRAFGPEPVRDELLTRVLDAARWTGSARNRQPWKFVVVRSASLRAELGTLGAYAGPLAVAPVAVLLAGDTQTGGADLDFDLGRLAQSLMLAAAAAGLGSCPVTIFPDANVDRARTLSGLDAHWRIRTAIALGHPAAAPPGRRLIPSGRHPLQDLVVDLG